MLNMDYDSSQEEPRCPRKPVVEVVMLYHTVHWHAFDEHLDDPDGMSGGFAPMAHTVSLTS